MNLIMVWPQTAQYVIIMAERDEIHPQCSLLRLIDIFIMFISYVLHRKSKWCHILVFNRCDINIIEEIKFRCLKFF